MARRNSRIPRWWRRSIFAAALGLGPLSGWLGASEPRRPPEPPAVVIPVQATTETPPPLAPFGEFFGGDPLAPSWLDPVSNVPNFMGDFFARSACVSRNTFTSRTLHFTGAGAEGFNPGLGSFVISAPLTANGPGGPYTLNNDIPYTPSPTFPLPENPEFTPLVRAQFPGATFITGGGTDDGEGDLTFFYDYLFTSGRNITVNLPNPSGGGLIGRNNYFDNGSPVPHDRIYFLFDNVGNFQGLGTPLSIQRYIFGFEKTLLDRFSMELRIPFAGTAASDQTDSGNPSSDVEFGNLGLLLKSVVFRTPNFMFSVGMGVSLPTANDSRLLIDNVPIVVIQNRACILQPLIGLVWAPDERFYVQAGFQMDFDPSGNPVQVTDAAGNLGGIGVLRDQQYAFLSTAIGYWLYQSNATFLSRIALQGELHYDSAFGTVNSVQDGNVSVTDCSSINFLDATAGLVFQFGPRTTLSIGMSFPLAGDRLYDWNLQAQLDWRFGPR